MPDHAITWIGSPHHSRGRGGYRPRAIVIHVMQSSLACVDEFFNNRHPAPDLPVSAHYGIGSDGRIHQYVAESDAAWHAGRVSAATWSGIVAGVNPNRYTIGLEHEGVSGEPWSEAMYQSSAWLIAQIANRWSIPIGADSVIRHADIYAVKHFCPGTGVDLPTLIELARSELLSGNGTNFVPMCGSTIAQTDLHLRIGAPSSHAESGGAIARGTTLAFVGWTSNGEAVHANAHWYRTADGEYAWAGATAAPVPGG